MACWHIMCNTCTCLELRYIPLSWRTYGLGESNQKSSRGIQRSPHLYPPQPSTDQHMWWRMTHLFFYKGCVYVKLLKCIKMSSTLGGPPRLCWKITRWKYNFSAGEPGIWTELGLPLLSLTLFLSSSLQASPSSVTLVFLLFGCY